MEIEQRVYDLAELRVEPDSDGKPKISGYAAMYNAMSEDLGGFKEIIQPGFFDGVIGDDVRALWGHDHRYVLGRVKSGTLKVWSDEKGLRFEAAPPETQWARDAIESMRRGDVDQASFGFRVREGGDEWRKGADGTILRTLKPNGCERLQDVSPVAFPAYPQTSISVRSRLEEISRTSENPSGGGQETVQPDDQGRAALEMAKEKIRLMEV